VTKNDDALVPKSFRTSDEYSLGAWVGQQRVKKDDIPQDRRKRLEALKDWVWDVLSYQWEQGFKYLKQYVADYGDALVSNRYRAPDGYNLGNWVSHKR
jgi:hypothetical protein